MGFTFKPSPTNNINPFLNKKRTGCFYSHNYYTVWQTNDKSASWKHIYIDFGIRRSELIQLFPIWNTSHNCEKSLLFGIWKFYFQIGYRY